jgi:hypothetical protein
VLALYWQGLPKNFARKCEEDRIVLGDRALPTLLLAVSECLGTDQSEFGS